MRFVRCALFDMDGALTRDYISSQFVTYLNSMGMFKKSEHDLICQLRDRYNKMEISYDHFADEWAKAWGRGIAGRDVYEVKRGARDFISGGHSSTFYEETRAIMELLKSCGYKRFLISTGMIELVGEVNNYLGMDGFLATEAETLNGVYTGRLATDLHTVDGKGKAIAKLMDELELEKPEFAFGDSSNDASMLEIALHPVALNPDAGLRRIAQEKGWLQLDMLGALQFLIVKLNGSFVTF